MRRSVRKWLAISSAVFVISGYLSLIAANVTGPWILIVPLISIALMPVCRRLDTHYPGYRLATRIITLIFTLMLPFLIVSLGLYHGLVILIVFIQVHKMAHRRERKDYYHIFLMAFFLLLCACVQNPGAGIAPVLVAFVLSAIWSFMLFHIEGEITLAGDREPADILPSHDMPTTMAPAAKGLRGHGFTWWAAVVSASAFLLLTGVFLVTPRMEAGLLARPMGESAALTTGLTTGVDLTQSGTITPNAAPLMKVTFPDEPGGQYDGEMYWRSLSFNDYTGTQWRLRYAGPRVMDDTPDFEFIGQRRGRLQVQPLPDDALVHQRIALSDLRPMGVPALTLPLVYESQTLRLIWDSRQDLVVRGAIRHGVALGDDPMPFQYDAWSWVRNPNPDDLRQARDVYRWVMPGYELLTRHHLDPRVQALAEEVTADYDNIYDKVKAIEQWLSSDEFTYTFDIPEYPSRNPVDSFVLDVRTGHCQVFASAMALMVRSLGIPAQVVSGFRGGEWDEAEQAYIVRSDMAHLWVEVYFIDYGWVTFDPAPSPGEEEYNQGWFDSFAVFSLKLQRAWYQYVVSYTGGVSVEVFRDVVVGLFGVWTGADPMSGAPTIALTDEIRLTMIAVSVMLAAVAMYLLARIIPWSRLFAHKDPLTPDQQRAVGLYHAFKRRLARLHIVIHGKTASELLLEVQGHPGLDEPLAAQVVQTYHDVRFGRQPLSASEMRELTAELRRLGRTR